jgi:hypothetical protein
MDISTIFLVILFTALAILLTILLIKKNKAYNAIRDRFKDVVDKDEERDKIQKQIDELEKNRDKLDKEYEAHKKTLSDDYHEKRAVYEKLLKEISILEEDLEFISFGIYKPHFDFDTSERYKAKINENIQRQKDLISAKRAAYCGTQWTVSGSKSEGTKMTNRQIKLMVRAFNGECESAIANVRWNNADKMEARIRKACEAINKLGEVNQVYITNEYLNLKLEELYLSYEYQEKKHQEQEEQRRIREEIREEERAAREYEKAKEEAEKEEKRYENALEKARAEISEAHGEKLDKLNEQIALLEAKLKEAQEAKERAVSMAQLTKSGHIYVISNIGSFGEDVYKIGMTRRLEPLDRVRELGDASVPFYYDVHAMIYTEDAPTLENELHQRFHDRRLNLVNLRREFFNVSLEEIENAVREKFAEIEFTKIAEAREYRETQSIKEQNQKQLSLEEKIEKEFPAEL